MEVKRNKLTTVFLLIQIRKKYDSKVKVKKLPAKYSFFFVIFLLITC